MIDLSRNAGLLSRIEQDLLRAAHVVVCGVGGMGGVAVEALCRLGVGRITIADHDVYEASNINRQIHCTQASIGRPKVEVVGEKLLAINPDLNLSMKGKLSAELATELTTGADIVINAMDDVRASITLERAARRARRTIVDAWLTPYASVFVMTPDAPHWEEFLDLPSRGRPVEALTDAEVAACLRREVAFTLAQFEPYSIVSPQLVERVVQGQTPRPSLVPVVWLSGVLMANEAMKIITGRGKIATHWGVFYDQYEHRVRYLDGAGTCVGDLDDAFRGRLAG